LSRRSINPQRGCLLAKRRGSVKSAYGSEDPDPFKNFTDLEHFIRKKLADFFLPSHLRHIFVHKQTENKTENTSYCTEIQSDKQSLTIFQRCINYKIPLSWGTILANSSLREKYEKRRRKKGEM
jgi:hypothetical protein